MKQADKIRFIRALMQSIRKEMESKIGLMPDEWDGIEIRQLLFEKFRDETVPRQMSGKRRSNYRNTVAMSNL